MLSAADAEAKKVFDTVTDGITKLLPKGAAAEFAATLAKVDLVARHYPVDGIREIGSLLRPVWKLLHQLPMYAAAPRSALPVAEDQAQRLVNLPSSPQLLN